MQVSDLNYYWKKKLLWVSIVAAASSLQHSTFISP